ncbi:MAG: hypothetical protein RIQ79_689 [Verrucomicrobiota bacterium]
MFSLTRHTPDKTLTAKIGKGASASDDLNPTLVSIDQFVADLVGGTAELGMPPINGALCVLARATGATHVFVLQKSGTLQSPYEIVATTGSFAANADSVLQQLGAAIEESTRPGTTLICDLAAQQSKSLAAVCKSIAAPKSVSTVFAQRLSGSPASPLAILVALVEKTLPQSSPLATFVAVASLHVGTHLESVRHVEALRGADRRWRDVVATAQSSEIQFHEVLQNTDDAVFFLRVEPGPRFIYERVNPRLTKLTGISAEDIIGRTAAEVFPPSGAARFERDYFDCWQAGVAITREQHVVLGNGGFVFRTTLIPVRGSDSTIVRLIGFATDLTDLRQQQILLSESEAVARTGGWDINGITGSLRWTPGTHLIFETKPEIYQPTFESSLSFYTEDCRAAVEYTIRNAMQIGSSFDFTATARTTTGRLINLRSLGITESVDGRVVRVLGATLDVTAQHLAEQERQLLETQLRRAQKMQAIGTLAGGIAHDFNNILAGIMGNVQLAASDLPEGDPMQRFLDRAFQSCTRARDLVKRMLTFSRQVEQTHASTSLQPLIEEAVALLHSSLPANVTIKTVFPPAPLVVMADPGQIHQVLLNLATNGAHAMTPTGGTLTLELAASSPDDIWHRRHPQVDLTHCVRLCVRDTGCGMDNDTVERIFEPFFTTKPFGEGSGLGLAMVHGIIENHGASIVVESFQGIGSAFHLFFPAPVRAVAPATFTPQPARTAVAVGRGQHILAVDDESTITALVGSVLNHLGYRSTVVQNPQEALDRFKLSPADFDCLLTDFSMPGMNGIDLANAMRIIRPDIPVVIMTGFLRAHDLAPLRDSGVHHLINKPFSMETLANKLSEVFRSAATAPLSSLD